MQESDSEYESATEEVHIASSESQMGVNIQTVFKETIKALPVEEDFQQGEGEIMALAERGSIERAEVEMEF